MLKIINQRKDMSVKEFTDIKINKKIKLEHAFQRGTDESSSWNDQDKKSYIDSTLRGTATNAIHLVDVKKAMEFNEGGDTESYNYFSKLHKEGYKWLSIDGNNRSIAMKDFRNGEFNMFHKEYHTKNRMVGVKKQSDSYDTMDGLLKKVYDDSTILLIIYENVTLKQCSELFRDVNMGKSLNDQQFRQSYLSDFADYIRDLRSKHQIALSKFLTPAEIRELDGDEFIAKMVCYAYSGEHDKNRLNKLYFKVDDGHVEQLRVYSSKSDFSVTVNKFFSHIKTGTNKLSKNAVFDYFILLWNYKLDDIKVTSKFYDMWLENYQSLQSDDKLYQVHEQESMFTFGDTVRKPLNKFGEFRQETVKEKIENKAIKKKYLIQQGEQRHRFFTDKQKFQMWKLQDKKTPDGKTNIPLKELYDHTKWQADHIDPWDHGGETTIENGQLISAGDNNAKSNKV